MSDRTTDPEHIESDLEHTRSRLDSRLTELGERLSPGQLLDEAMQYFRTSQGAAFASNLGETVRERPVPAALAGIGLAWLAATDGEAPPTSTPATRLGRLTRSPAGSALGNAMTGMADALYGPRRDEVAVVAEAPGEPPGDDPFEVRLDPQPPERSQVVHRKAGPEPGAQPGGSR